LPNHRILASCVALSFLMHLVMVAGASLIPWPSRVAESVMVVDLADLPRAPDFLPPKAGILKGGRPKPPPPKPPRVMEGRVRERPVNPALPPEASFPPPRPGED